MDVGDVIDVLKNIFWKDYLEVSVEDNKLYVSYAPGIPERFFIVIKMLDDDAIISLYSDEITIKKLDGRILFSYLIIHNDIYDAVRYSIPENKIKEIIEDREGEFRIITIITDKEKIRISYRIP